MPKKKSTGGPAQPKSAKVQPEKHRYGKTPKEYKEASLIKKVVWRIIDGLSSGS